MPEIEPCLCCGSDCLTDHFCSNGEKYFFYVSCTLCRYQHQGCSTQEDAIAAHNKLSHKVQRAEQLERFAELAVPIVNRTREYYLNQYERTGFRPDESIVECELCLAVLEDRDA